MDAPVPVPVPVPVLGLCSASVAWPPLTCCSLLPIPQVKTGLVMNILGILCVSLAINTWGVAMFNLTDNPDWAHTNKTTQVL